MSIAAGSTIPGLLFLELGLGLALSGMALILYSARMTREAVARRVDLVRGKFTMPRAGTIQVSTSFTRDPAQGASMNRRQAVIHLFGKLGVPAEHAPQVLLFVQLGGILLTGSLAYVITGHYRFFASSFMLHALASFGFGLAAWFLPGAFIGHDVKRRAKAIVGGLPDALELLVICVEAGLSFEDGIDRIVVELRQSQPELAHELELTSADLKILPSREEALANLAARVSAPSVKSVVTTLTQTMRYGTPLAQALRSVAAELRNDVVLKMEERANQLPTIMTIPMIIFLMPTIFLIVGGPAALRLMDAFKK